MASPVVEGTNTSTSGNSPHTVNLPASIAANDILIVLIGVNTDATIAGTLTTEYSQMFDDNTASNDTHQGYWKLATGSEGATVGFTDSNGRKSGHNSYRISGALNAAPTVSTVVTGSSTAPDPGNIAPGVGSETFLWLASFVAALGTDTAMTSAPTSYSAFINAQIGAGSGGVSIGSAWRQTTAAAEDPGAFTIGSDAWVTFGIGIRPSGVAVVTRPRIVVVNRAIQRASLF